MLRIRKNTLLVVDYQVYVTLLRNLGLINIAIICNWKYCG